MVFFIIGLYHFQRDFHAPAPLYILNPNFLWNDTSFLAATFSLCNKLLICWNLQGDKHFYWEGGEERSSICFPNKNPGTWDVEIGACFSAASGEGARVWDLLLGRLWGEEEGKWGLGNCHYSSLCLNWVFYIHFHALIWSSHTIQEKDMSISILEMRLQRLNVFLSSTEVVEQWNWNSDLLMAEFKTLPPTAGVEKCSFVSCWLWVWNLILQVSVCLGRGQFVKPDGQARSRLCL